MHDRTGLKTALPSVGYHNAGTIDNEAELFIGCHDNKKIAIIVLDNRCDMVASKHGIDRFLEVARNDARLTPDFNILIVITDVCKDRRLQNIKNVLYFNEYNYTLKGGRCDKVFKKDIELLKQLTEALAKERFYTGNKLGLLSAFSDHAVIATPIFIIVNILVYAFFYKNADVFGVSKNLMEAGEYYRILSYAVMHGSILHLAFNMLSLWFIGKALEKQIGVLPFITVYVVSAIIGAEVSVYFTESPDIPTVGASGAICGLIAANIISVMFLPKERHGTAITASFIWLASILIYGTMENVDNYCHIGGILGGALAMLIIDMAISIVFSEKICEANEYYYKRLNKIRKRMLRYNGSRERNPRCYILNE